VIFDKNGGKIGVPGSVAFSFVQRGQVIVEGGSEEQLMNCCLEAGADDIQGDGETFQVLCAPADLLAVRTAIEAAKLTVDSAEVVWIPQQTVEVSAEAMPLIEKIVDALEDHDDVQKVFTSLA
jgi:transcriptional/translational regulatory protein YebC/TACO1